MRTASKLIKILYLISLMSEHMINDESSRMKKIEAKIGLFPDFPKKGVNFRDIFPMVREPELLKDCCCLLAEHIQKNYGIVDVIVGLDSRGFIFGPLVAQELKAAFVPVRKKGKLPGEVLQVSYSLEYGTDTFEIQKGSIQQGDTVVILDDVIATGGTMHAAEELVEKLGGIVKECLVVIELAHLKGKDKLTTKFHSLIQYEGE